MYASGTQNAAPGLALVGEEGPELVYFNGGEKVVNAAQTSAMQSKVTPAVSALPAVSGGSNSGLPPIQIVIQVSGTPTPETAAALQDSAGTIANEVAERVMDMLEAQQTDARRLAFT